MRLYLTALIATALLRPPGPDVQTWLTYTAADGALWFATSGGVSRYDGTTWRSFTTADGLARNSVNAVLELATERCGSVRLVAG